MQRGSWRRGAGRVAASLILRGACSEVDDPSLHPVSNPYYEAPAPPLRSEAFDPRRNVFWGDLHIHSSYSYDAYTFGVRALPDDAYRFAKGEAIAFPPVDANGKSSRMARLGVTTGWRYYLLRRQFVLRMRRKRRSMRLRSTGND